MDKIKQAFQKFARAVVDPVLYLAIVGIFLAISVVFGLDGVPKFLADIGTLVNSMMNSAIIGNLALLMCIGLAGGLAKKQKVNACVLGLMVYIMFIYANNTYLTMTGMLIESGAAGMDLFATGQATVLGLQVTDVNVVGGIILGCLTGYIYNKCVDVKFPEFFGIYGGPRFAFIVMIPVTLILAVVSCYIWPPIADAIHSISLMIQNAGGLGVFIFGFLNRALIPTGLHHFMWMPFSYTPVGGTAEIAGELISGGANIFYAEMPYIANGSLTVLDPSIRFEQFAFAKEFVALGIALAFVYKARPENRKAVAGMILPIYVVASISGITEAFDFTVLFASPILWIMYGVFAGLGEMTLYFLGSQVFNIYGYIELLTINLPLPISTTKLYIYLLTGVVFIALTFVVCSFMIDKLKINTPGRAADWSEEVGSESDAGPTEQDVDYIIEGLGGKDNIKSVGCCMTRLRASVNDVSKVDESIIKKANQRGVIISGSEVQIVIGVKVQELYDMVKPILKVTE